MTDRRLREKNNKRGPRNRCGKKARKKKENKAGNKRIPVRNSPRCRCSFIFLSLSFFFVSVSNFVLPVFRYFFFLHLFCLLSFTVSVPSKTKRRERKGHVYINIFYFFLFLFHFFLLFVSSFRRFDGRRTRTDQSTGRGVGGSRWMLETGAYLKFFRLGVAGRNGNTAAVTAITTAAADSSLHGIPTIPALTPFFCFPWFLLCFLFSLFFFHLPCVCVCVCVRPCVFARSLIHLTGCFFSLIFRVWLDFEVCFGNEWTFIGRQFANYEEKQSAEPIPYDWNKAKENSTWSLAQGAVISKIGFMDKSDPNQVQYNWIGHLFFSDSDIVYYFGLFVPIFLPVLTVFFWIFLFFSGFDGASHNNLDF